MLKITNNNEITCSEFNKLNKSMTYTFNEYNIIENIKEDANPETLIKHACLCFGLNPSLLSFANCFNNNLLQGSALKNALNVIKEYMKTNNIIDSLKIYKTEFIGDIYYFNNYITKYFAFIIKKEHDVLQNNYKHFKLHLQMFFEIIEYVRESYNKLMIRLYYKNLSNNCPFTDSKNETDANCLVNSVFFAHTIVGLYETLKHPINSMKPIQKLLIVKSIYNAVISLFKKLKLSKYMDAFKNFCLKAWSSRYHAYFRPLEKKFNALSEFYLKIINYLDELKKTIKKLEKKTKKRSFFNRKQTKNNNSNDISFANNSQHNTSAETEQTIISNNNNVNA